MRIFLCGGIKKDDNDKKIVWSEEDKQAIMKILPEAELIDPQRVPEGYDPVLTFGADINDIREADVVMVDARQKRGIGIGAEMAIAKVWKKPVVALAPKKTHFRRDIELNGREVNGWIHPFLFSLSDHVAETVEEAAEWVRDFRGKVKDEGFFQEAIDHYNESGRPRS